MLAISVDNLGYLRIMPRHRKQNRSQFDKKVVFFLLYQSMSLGRLDVVGHIEPY
nr:MAG TPA: hypothetical protein [Caudoviricetes sp.]